jgi:hypothetical protein
MKTRFLFQFAFVLAVLLAACAPEPGNAGADREPVYIDSADLLIAESFPVQVRLHIVGNLPSPCHEFQFEVEASDGENQIHVTAYSTIDPAAMCAQVLQPFDQTINISMASGANGTYSVWLNGEQVGEFSYPG